MDDSGSEVLVELVKLETPLVSDDVEGAVLVVGQPVGPRMGRIHLKRGHQALLPKGAAYRFTAVGETGVLLIQSIAGALTQYRWAEICQTV
jgi:homogentisate 1,2-dioxygenase